MSWRVTHTLPLFPNLKVVISFDADFISSTPLHLSQFCTKHPHTLSFSNQSFLARPRTGDPVPHLDISFPDSSEFEDLSEMSMGAVCWPNPLLGECKEAAISHTELTDLISEWDGDDFLLDTCTCASEGFSTAITTKKKDDDASTRKTPPRERSTGVQTYAPTPRVTLCFFDGITPDHGVWEIEGGSRIQKGAFCKQVTIDRSQYKMKRFNDDGLSECKGGCAELGYGVLMESASKQVATLRKKSKRTSLEFIPRRYRKTSPGEWVYIYHSTDYDPRVTLCFFDGEEIKDSSGAMWWNTNEKAAVRKREFCRQVTISRDLYVSTAKAPRRKERFNKYGIYECGKNGGCAQMGYSVLLKSKELYDLSIREDTPAAVGGPSEAPPSKKRRKSTTGRIGKPYNIRLTHLLDSGEKQGRERVDTYAPSKKVDM